MDRTYLLAKLQNQAEIIAQMVKDVDAEQGCWKPDADTWSVLEVINHLYDEEREDFRRQLDIILHKTSSSLAEIDPKGWVTQRQYNRRDLVESLEKFLAERAASITWLDGLAVPDWGASIETPFGPITAGDMAASWVAHDLLHTRQLVELRWAYTTVKLQPYNVAYAGGW